MQCTLVTTPEAFLACLAELGVYREISVDSETSMLDTHHKDFEIVGVCLGGDDQKGYYIPVGHRTPPGEEATPPANLDRAWVLRLLDRFLVGRRVVGANHKFDHHVFGRYGVEMGTTTFDVLLAAPVFDGRDTHCTQDDVILKRLRYKPIKIKELCAKVKPKGQSKVKRRRQRMGFEFLRPEEATPYAAADAVNAVRLRDWYRPRVDKDPDLRGVLNMEHELLPAIKEMTLVGVLLDKGRLKALHDGCLKIESKCAETCRRIAGNPELNLRSGLQVGDVIYYQFGVPHPKGRKFKQGTRPPKGFLNKEAREALGVYVRSKPRENYNGWSADQVLEFLDDYNKYSRLGKLRSTYTLNLLELMSDDGRLRPDLKQIGAESGRLSSSNPNGQNIPRADDPITRDFDVRSAFVADEGYVFIGADYAAQEMRVIAALSGDETLRKIFSGEWRDPRGDEIDVHAYVGSLAFDQAYLPIVDAVNKKASGEKLTNEDKQLVKVRQDSKPVNFGISYGQTSFGLAVQLKSTEAAAKHLLNTWKTKAFPQAAAWMDGLEAELRVKLYTTTPMGRRRRISPGSRGLTMEQFRKIVRPFKNHPIQGAAADMIKAAMIRTHRNLASYGDRARLLFMIHDDLLTLCREDVVEEVTKIIVASMETELNGVRFPVDVSVAKTWSKSG